MYPHRILSYLFDEVGIEIDDSAVAAYWNHLRAMGEPWACAHPATEQHVPLGVHGDSARLWTQYKVEKIMAIHMNIVHFRPRSTRHSRFLLFSCPREKLVKNRTLNVIWKRLVWSWNACFRGLNPTVGPNGAPLLGKHLERAGSPICKSGRKFSLCELRGDWEWHRDVWRFTASWQAINVCFRCPAVRSGDPDHLYFNNELNCKWQCDEFSLEEFVSQRLKDNQLCTIGSSATTIFVFVLLLIVSFYNTMFWLKSTQSATSVGRLCFWKGPWVDRYSTQPIMSQTISKPLCGVQTSYKCTKVHFSCSRASILVVWDFVRCIPLILA